MGIDDSLSPAITSFACERERVCVYKPQAMYISVWRMLLRLVLRFTEKVLSLIQESNCSHGICATPACIRVHQDCMYVYTYVCMYVCTYVCMYVRMYVCMYVCNVSLLYVCMYINYQGATAFAKI